MRQRYSNLEKHYFSYHLVQIEYFNFNVNFSASLQIILVLLLLVLSVQKFGYV